MRWRGVLVWVVGLVCLASQVLLPKDSGAVRAEETGVLAGEVPRGNVLPANGSRTPAPVVPPPVNAVQAQGSAAQAAPANVGSTQGSAAQAAPVNVGPAQGSAALAASVNVGSTKARDGAKAQAPLQLIYRTVALPTGHVGMAYGPRRIVEGGMPPYTFAFTGKFPPGLELGADGMLAGTPTTVDRYAFQLVVRDSSVPPVTTQQPYVLRVELEKAPAQSPPVMLTREEADAIANPHPDAPVTYLLTLDALKGALAQRSGSAATDANTEISPVADSSNVVSPNRPAAQNAISAGGAVSAVGPALAADSSAINVEQLEAVVAPVINVEYPSVVLFKAALGAAHCAYYQEALLQRPAGKSPVDLTCPPPPATTKGVKSSTAATVPGGKAVDASTPAAGAAAVLTLREYYDQLLPDSVRDSLVSAAETFHPLNESLPPADITGNGCGCAPRNGQDDVYGFYPFWGATKSAQPIDFSLFTRVGYMGVVLNPAGDYTTPPNWLDQSGNFARTVHRFNTRLDLVVYRQEWSWLLALSDKQISTLAEQAGRTAVGMVDTPLEGPFTLKPFWLPFWQESAHAYDGITVFFDYPRDRLHFSAAGVDKFQAFLLEYLRQVVLAMQHRGRAYNLNIVVPDDLVGEEGPFSFHNLIRYIELAEPATTRKGTASLDDFADYKGISPITVDLLVLMREPTSDHKKLLRAGIDQLTAPYDGHRRVALLQSIVPVVFHRGGLQQGAATALHGTELDKDIAYYQWTYGGVGFWPVPVATVGDGAAVMSVLHKDFSVENSAAGPMFEAASESGTLCRLVCPNRNLVRLLFELLVLASVGLGVAYMVTCRVRRAGWPYLALLVSSALALVCGGLLLNCDPTLYELKQGNWLLLAVVAGLGVFIVYKSYRPRVSRP